MQTYEALELSTAMENGAAPASATTPVPVATSPSAGTSSSTAVAASAAGGNPGAARGVSGSQTPKLRRAISLNTAPPEAKSTSVTGVGPDSRGPWATNRSPYHQDHRSKADRDSDRCAIERRFFIASHFLGASISESDSIINHHVYCNRHIVITGSVTAVH